MFGPEDTWKLHYSGDDFEARMFEPLALVQAGLLKEHAFLGPTGELKSAQRTVKLGEAGGFIRVVKTWAHYDIFVFVPETSKIDDVAEEEQLVDVHILCVSVAGAVYAYDYKKNTRVRTTTAPVEVTSLDQFFNQYNHINSNSSVWRGRGVAEIAIFGSQVAKSANYELEFLRKLNSIYARGISDSGLIISIDLSGALWSDLDAAMMGDFLGLPVEVTEKHWNFYSGLVTLGLPIASRNVQELFKWLPSIFYIQPNNLDYTPGWYYGQRGGWLGASNVNDLTVDFVSLMDTKAESVASVFGYCERLTDVNGVVEGTLNFFLSSVPPVEPTDYETYKSPTEFIYGGTLFTGYNRTFSTNPYPGDETTAGWWNYIPWADPAKQDAPSEACGVVISAGEKATVYRYNGVLASVYSTKHYHSHSVNALGTMVAVFEAVEGVINSVAVIDLYGEKFTVDGVIVGPTFILRAGGNLSATDGEFGEWVPTAKVPTVDAPPALQYVLGDGASIPYEFSNGSMASLASMSYPETGNGVVNFHNVMVEGTRATISDTVDECFETVIIIDPDPSGLHVNHTEGRGTVAGSYSGEKGSVIFEAEGSGVEVKRLTPSISADITTGAVSLSGFMGEIVSHSGYDDVTMTLDSLECSTEISATSSCGQTALSVVDAGESPLELSVGYSGSTPSALNAAGGVTPYSYSISCGSVDSETGLIGDTSMCCGGITGTVEDACGTIVSVDIRAANGRWVEDASKSKDWRGDCSFGPGANVGCDEISGLVKISWTMHTVVSCPGEPIIPPCGIYEAIAYRWFDWVC